MERTIRQQAQELTQLHRTVGHLTNLVDARAAHEEAQRLAMMTWMHEREQKWDARYEDDKVWGGGHHEHDFKDHQRGSGRPGGERERKRCDCEDGRRGARGLPTYRHDASRGTGGAPAAAAACKAQAQNAAQNAVYTAAHAQTKVSTHTR
jgi:hypothetical protein